MTAFLLRLERAFETFRHVPPRQLLRRLELLARRRLDIRLPARARTAPPPRLSDRPPPPIFPPRTLLEPAGHGWRLHQPWGSLALPASPDWRLEGPEAAHLDAPERRSWHANLSYMEFLEGVDDSVFAGFLESWMEAHPPATVRPAHPAWRPYNLSIRAVVWMQQLARRRARLDPALLERAATSLGVQLRFLERHLETDVRGNHLIRNIKALLWGGRFFAGGEAEAWRRRAQTLLEEELVTQILGDGGHFERSPSYHCQVMGDLLEILSLLEPGRLRTRLEAALAAMARACRVLTHPDGRIALFNDGGLDLAYPPAVLLEAMAGLGLARPERPEGPFALNETGFYGLIKGDDYLVVDCGPIGPDALIGHAHGDILSFEWSAGGRRLVVDQGTCQYRAGPRRRESRSAASHNTVVVDDAEPSDFFGEFRCGRRARPELLAFRPGPDGFVLVGSHDGFRRLPGRPRHVRRIEASPATIEIVDTVEAEGRHEAAAGLLLHPDCEVVIDGRRAWIENGPVAASIDSSIAPVLEPAEWYPNLHVRRPTHRLRYRWPVPGEALRLVLRRQR